MTPRDVFDTEYEAYFRLIGDRSVPPIAWIAWCTSKACRVDVEGWHYTGHGRDATRVAGLAHCRERHVRLTGW